MRCAVKCTIKDVAKAAGVSPSTVSRALHNNPRISEQARERIRALAKEMGFHPNQMARSLVNRRTRVIGIVFPANLAESLGHPFYPQVLQGLGQTAAERRHYVLLGTGQGGETTPEAIRQLVDSGYVSGLVLLAAEEGIQPPEDVPTVVIGHPCGGGLHYVDSNNLRAGQTAAEYLIRRGHRRIALLGYDKQYMVTTDRRAGYEQALRFNGLPLREDYIVPSRYMDNATDQAALLRLFRQPDHPTAVVCMDDAQAISLTHTLSAIGLKVPEDVSLISFNNTEAGRFHHPPLTSFDVNPYQLGVEAMNMILDLVKEKPASLQLTKSFLFPDDKVFKIFAAFGMIYGKEIFDHTHIQGLAESSWACDQSNTVLIVPPFPDKIRLIDIKTVILSDGYKILISNGNY